MYYEVDVIVEGALDDSEVFTEEQRERLSAYLAEVEESAKDSGLATEVFIQSHYHSQEPGECLCVQYETDHKPDYSWNINDS